MNISIKARGPLVGEIFVEPDKSISHRSIILAALGRGKSVVRNFLNAQDTLSTCACIQSLGINIHREKSLLTIEGKGLTGFSPSPKNLDCGNSGTTMRLIAGLLAGQPFTSHLYGDDSLNKRPMGRVIEPLRLMEADISGYNNTNYAPLTIRGKELKGITFKLPIPSAQVKSAILLAGLNANSATSIIEPVKARDHTERMLTSMGADLKITKDMIIITPGQELIPQEFLVPGDISSAAFFLVAASIIPGSQLQIKNVGINPTRSGIIDVLQLMGANIKIENRRIIGGEPVADLVVSAACLKGIEVKGEVIPRLIDEIPVLAVAMAAADGQSIITDAGELRVKETDRIRAICSELIRLGVDIKELDDGLLIKGRQGRLIGNQVDSYGDHRIAMSLAIAGLLAEGETIINNSQVVNISFPGFWNLLTKISQ